MGMWVKANEEMTTPAHAMRPLLPPKNEERRTAHATDTTVKPLV